jgi:hypothetical protein
VFGDGENRVSMLHAEFKTRDGTTFTVRPGDVVLAEDTTGSGHSWRLIGDEPWCRAYVVLRPDAADIFTPRSSSIV